MIDRHPEEMEHFPRAGARARRWSRFERDLYSWMNRPEGQFECWLANRKILAGSGVGVAGAAVDLTGSDLAGSTADVDGTVGVPGRSATSDSSGTGR